VTYSLSAIPLSNRLRVLSLLTPLLFIALCGCVKADVAKLKTSLCGLTEVEATGLNGDAGTDIHAVSDYSKVMYRLLQAGRFEQLDCLADSVRLGKEKFPGGLWKIHAVYTDLVLPPLHPTSEDWKTHLELVERWVAVRPDSITARVALAETYVNYAADARGPGFSATVSDSGWKLLAERTAKAKQILDEAEKLPAKDPEWYVAMQNVALSNWEREAKQALFEKAVKFEPDYYYYYRLYANSILPKWGGEEGETANFLKKSADDMGGESGDILYFRVAGTLVCGCETDQNLQLSWPRILKGFDAVEKRDGSSLENLNLLAHMAMSFHDPAVANKAFAQIGEQWSTGVWGNSSEFESARNWAKQMAPITARKRAAEEPAEANLRTPEGKQYNAAFAEQIQTWMQPCLKELAGSDLGNFELLIKVGRPGTIEDITGGGNSPLMSCLGHKINDFRVAKQAVFPPPPQPDYWVRYDFDSDTTSATLR